MDSGEQSTPPGGIPEEPSPQSTLLNFLLPGFSVVTAAANSYLGTDVSVYLPALVGIIGAAVAWEHVRESVWSLVAAHLMSSVRIRTDDEIYNMVMLWISRQDFAHNSRHFLANTDISSRSLFVYHFAPDGHDSDDDADDGDTGDGGDRRQALHYTPAFGMHLFWYRGRPLLFERQQNREQPGSQQTASEREELSLSCFGRSPRILKELLLEARQMHLDRDEHKTLIYRGNLGEAYWQRCMSRLSRPLSTVVLDGAVKRALLDDAADYLAPATRRWYANRGIPYRRGYLLHGPPGTGKSSLSLALAGHFRMKIFIVSLSSTAATEENVTTLFNDLPTRCIVLLEDIDTAGLTHTRDGGAAYEAGVPAAVPAADAVPAQSPDATPPPAAAGRLSLSGLLNILDGVASQEGRILIMTTNHMDKLDKALIRPGRVDVIVPFGLADANMASSIFRAIYAPHDGDDAAPRRGNPGGAGKTSCDGEAQERERARVRERVDVLAQRFAARIPELEFSPAEVQGLLLRHKRSPEEAIDAAAGWVEQMRRDREAEYETKGRGAEEAESGEAESLGEAAARGEDAESWADSKGAEEAESSEAESLGEAAARGESWADSKGAEEAESSEAEEAESSEAESLSKAAAKGEDAESWTDGLEATEVAV